MTIARFLKQHGTSLPVLLKVSQGYKSFLEKYSFGQDQVFVALEKKEIYLVTCEDPNMKQIYEIPLDEELVVSPVLPDCFTEEGIPSLLNSKELLGCSTLPRTFSAMKPFKDAKGHLVEQGTLLFPHKAGHPLVAITEEKRKVFIDKGTVGEFSIKYSDTKMLLKEAVKYFSFPFSCRLLTSNKEEYYAPVITIVKISKGLVIHGMMKSEGEITVCSFQKLSIIPASLKIQVTIMKTREDELLENIYDYATKAYYTSLQPSSQPHIQEYQSLISDESDTDAPHHSNRMSVMASRPLPHIPLSADYRSRSPSLPGPNKLNPVGQMSITENRIYDSADDVLPSASIMTAQIDLKSDIHPSTPSPHPYSGDSESGSDYVDLVEEDFEDVPKLKNIQTLKKLTVNQILLLLEKMNLSEYRDAFEQEHIDGILLASLDNEMLEELGVKKRIHKMRLRKIIEGEHSFEKYIC